MLIYHQYCRVENHSHICMQSEFNDQTKTFYIHVPGACMPNDFLVLGINQTKGYADCTVGNTSSALTYFSVALLKENLRPVIRWKQHGNQLLHEKSVNFYPRTFPYSKKCAYTYCSGKTCNIQQKDLSTLLKPTLLNWLHNNWRIKTLDPQSLYI